MRYLRILLLTVLLMYKTSPNITNALILRIFSEESSDVKKEYSQEK